MNGTQWFVYVILPAAIAVIGFTAGRRVEFRARKNKRTRDAATQGLKAAE
jgi:hypothetical protein